MKTAIRETVKNLIDRVLDGLAEPPPARWAPSPMVQLQLARSAAFAEAARRALHAQGGAP
jgi:hypothetical protein